jgi:WD40 repeat protein
MQPIFAGSMIGHGLMSILTALLAHPGPSALDSLDPARVEDRRPEHSRDLVAWLHGHNRAGAALAFSADGRLLASSSWDNTVRLWKIGQGGVKEWAVLEGSPSGLAFAPDGKSLVAGSPATTVHWWDVTGDKPKQRKVLSGHKNRPFAVAFSPKGSLLATGCAAPGLRVWKIHDGDVEAWGVLANEEGAAVGIASLSFSADGKLLAAGNYAGKNSLRVWDVSGKIMQELELPATRARLVLFAPTGPTLAFHGEGGTIHLWNMATPEQPKKLVSLSAHPMRGLDGTVRAMAFAPDGRTLASAGQDRRVALWDAGSGKKYHEWPMPEEVKALAFAPDGRHLATANEDGSIYLLRMQSLKTKE